MKIIKDIIHGYIEVDSMKEKIIDTLHFQRLKDIKQLTAYHVYPSATHTRFEHSLGVMFLSELAFSRLKPILINEFSLEKEKCDEMQFLLSCAALLHDIGHAPFSHLGENYYRKEEIRNNIRNVIEFNNLPVDVNIFDVGSSHELMSCYIILTQYIGILVSEEIQNVDIEFICRCIIGKIYKNREKWLEDIVIGLLNSDTIDMDKLDYLMRDSIMTGINIPKIDAERLFKKIYINPNSKRLTFRSQALSVVQNIIDARDMLYLWGYNHHTAVYTDFVIEFYIKHMILNYEKDNKFSDKLNPNEFFSCEAIAKGLVSDSDLYAKLKAPLSMDDKSISLYTKHIIPQIFERKFLKPLWKTIYEYRKFLEENIGDDSLIRELEGKMCDTDYCYRRYIAVSLINICKLDLGEIFIVPRSNKFYSFSPDSAFHIYLNDSDKAIGNLLPQRNFKTLYNNIAFYVFGKEDKLEEIKDNFIKLISNRLPDKSEITSVENTVEWFNYHQNER